MLYANVLHCIDYRYFSMTHNTYNTYIYILSVRLLLNVDEVLVQTDDDLKGKIQLFESVLLHSPL